MMIRCIHVAVLEGTERRFHQAHLEFKLDDEGLERLLVILRTQGIDVPASERPALPQGPIEGELIDE